MQPEHVRRSTFISFNQHSHTITIIVLNSVPQWVVIK